MAIDRDFKLELKCVPSVYLCGSEYEVWFTDSDQTRWRVSKPVNFERAIELLKFVNDMYTPPIEAVLMPPEFHIVGRMEPK